MGFNPTNLYLKRQSDGTKKHQYIQFKTARTSFGRSTQCDVFISGGKCSKVHCEIYFRDGKAYIKDLKSHAGTYLNSSRLLPETEHEISEGNVIGFGVNGLRPGLDTHDRKIFVFALKTVDEVTLETDDEDSGVEFVGTTEAPSSSSDDRTMEGKENKSDNLESLATAAVENEGKSVPTPQQTKNVDENEVIANEPAIVTQAKPHKETTATVTQAANDSPIESSPTSSKVEVVGDKPPTDRFEFRDGSDADAPMDLLRETFLEQTNQDSQNEDQTLLVEVPIDRVKKVPIRKAAAQRSAKNISQTIAKEKTLRHYNMQAAQLIEPQPLRKRMRRESILIMPKAEPTEKKVKKAKETVFKEVKIPRKRGRPRKVQEAVKEKLKKLAPSVEEPQLSEPKPFRTLKTKMTKVNRGLCLTQEVPTPKGIKRR